MTTDEPNVHTHEYATDSTHPRLREPDDDLPDIITPLDRIHPLTGRPRHTVTSGTVTGRAPLTRPSTSDTPTRLSFDDLHFNQDTARDLLNNAADLVREMAGPPALSSLVSFAERWTTDVEAWLARFEELGR